MRRHPTYSTDRSGGTPPPVTFTFEGKAMTARDGQSIAGALMARGVVVLTRSFKYHRPRGYTCGYGACGNCQLTVNGLPGVTACQTEVRNGDVVSRERGWPGTGFDVLRGADALKRFLGAGFQFRHLSRHPRLAHRWEGIMARFAGAGRMPTSDAALASGAREITTRKVDVLVIGGGLSGCSAALGAARTGAQVLLAHQGQLGGRSLGRRHSVDMPDGEPRPAHVAAAELAARIEKSERLEVVRGTVVGRFEEGLFAIAADGVLVEAIPSSVVVATGGYELPPVFAGNDKPGLMLADAVRRLLHVEVVRPGRRAVVVTDRDDGHRLAGELEAAGVHVVAILDSRAENQSSPATSSIPVYEGATVTKARGLRRIRALHFVASGVERSARCDVVCTALGERPAEELVLQTMGMDAGDPRRVAAVLPSTGRLTRDTWVVGSAAGSEAEDLAAAWSRGEHAADFASRDSQNSPTHVGPPQESP